MLSGEKRPRRTAAQRGTSSQAVPLLGQRGSGYVQLLPEIGACKADGLGGEAAAFGTALATGGEVGAASFVLVATSGSGFAAASSALSAASRSAFRPSSSIFVFRAWLSLRASIHAVWWASLRV